MTQGPVGAELAQIPEEPSVSSQFVHFVSKSIKNFFEISNEDPDRTAPGMRMLGGLAITFGAAEWFLIGSQSTGELLADSIFEVGGVGLIAASYLPGRNQ
jgi:hypothetical protein